MFRPYFGIVSLGLLFFPLLDMTLRGTVLLLLAGAACLALRGASAAARHLVWATAVVLLLAMPLLSLLLPGWHILPNWRLMVPEGAVSSVSATIPMTAPPMERQQAAPLAESAAAGPLHRAPPPLTDPAKGGVRPGMPESGDSHAEPRLQGQDAGRAATLVSMLWLVGCAFVSLRLIVAILLLRNSASRCRLVAPLVADSPSAASDGDRGERALRVAMDAAAARLGLRQSVPLLLDPRPSMPLVWGLWRPRLRLPAEAVDWDAEQQRSVVLHELAHVCRKDLVVLAMTQVVCALNWFNPLVWFAAWRLQVERERACDDLVLEAGVLPSTYAGHLLEVVGRLRPAGLAGSCGLAMARRSSLEDRLRVILSPQIDRRAITRAVAMPILAIGVLAAIPVAMVHAVGGQQAPAARVPTADSVHATETPGNRGPGIASRASESAVPTPRSEEAQRLWGNWHAFARADDKIPGALVGQLARELERFRKQSPADPKSAKLAALLPRLDASRDWGPAEAVALLDEIAEVSTAPVGWAELAMRFAEMPMLHRGEPLPVALAGAAWGQPQANGLQAAYLLEPQAQQYPRGSVVKPRVLFHNSGKTPIVFTTETWHQADRHLAHDAQGAEIHVRAVWYTGVTPTATYRLDPGEYCEVRGHGLAIGTDDYEEELSTGAVGAIVAAKEGDRVTLSHVVDAAEGGSTRPDDPKDPGELWKKLVAERVANEAPLPPAPAERQRLVRRVTFDLFGEAATAEEVAALVADKSPNPLARLTTRLQQRPRIRPWAGTLPTGQTQFRVTAPDPSAAKAPRSTNSPGRYLLGGSARLLVSYRSDGRLRTNHATIAFVSPDPKQESPHKPYEIALPEGIGTFGIAWQRGEGLLWILQKDLVRKYDFTHPAQIKETQVKRGGILDLPEHLRAAMRKTFDVPGAPVQQQNQRGPKEGTRLEPGTEERLQWGTAVGGLRAALVRPQAFGEPAVNELFDFRLVVQNVSEATIRFSTGSASPQTTRLIIYHDGAATAAFHSSKPAGADWILTPRAAAVLRLFPERTPGSSMTAESPSMSFTADLEIEKAPASTWSGKLVTAETFAAFAGYGLLPKQKDAKALFKVWNEGARSDGKIPGGLVGRLAESVTTFTKYNPTWATTPQLLKMLPRLDASRDWSGQEALALLDDLAALQATPIGMALEKEYESTIQTGTPLPSDVGNAPWGAALPCGLRMAWLLEPRAAEYRLGTALKSRILFHNAGKDAVVFRTRTWHQGIHKARDGHGAEIEVDSTYWTTLARLLPFRLAPGEFVEATAPGIGVGAMGNPEDWQNLRVGAWVEARAGDEVTLMPVPVPLGDWNEKPPGAGEPDWWLEFIRARLARWAPLPAEAAERQHLLYRVALDLFGTPLGADETAAFLVDREPRALEALAKRLVRRPGVASCTGSLTSGPTKFRVLPPDPDAAKRPRTANNPGRYTLAGKARLVVVRRPISERIVNEARIEFLASDPKQAPPGPPYELKLPDGYDTWATAWVRGATVLWLEERSGIRRYDFSEPSKVKEEVVKAEHVPAEIREALRASFAAAAKPVGNVATPRPASERR